MKQWLQKYITRFQLTEEAEGYTLGRGISDQLARDLHVGCWDSSSIQESAPDTEISRFGRHLRGELLDGHLCFPLFKPNGEVVGFEARSWGGARHVAQYRLPEAQWNPVFVGLNPKTFKKIWAGGNVWLVEGVFDLAALQHVVPAQDVVLATLRARVSNLHAVFLSRFCTGKVLVAYDNDKTGQDQMYGFEDPVTKKHRWGALDTLRWVGVRAAAVSYQGGKDPGEIWDAGGIPALKMAFQSYI
jgi:DNA primase